MSATTVISLSVYFLQFTLLNISSGSGIWPVLPFFSEFDLNSQSSVSSKCHWRSKYTNEYYLADKQTKSWILIIGLGELNHQEAFPMQNSERKKILMSFKCQSNGNCLWSFKNKYPKRSKLLSRFQYNKRI